MAELSRRQGDTPGQFVQRLLEEIRPEAALKSAALELDSPLPDVKLLLDPKRLRRAMAAEGLRELRFKFDFEGTRIIS